MKNLLFASLVLLLSACTKVEPGYVGIKVNQYGDQKGVEDFPLHTGAVWFNTFTTEVYKFPTFRQNVVWTKDTRDDDTDDSMTFNSIEGSVINADIALSYSLKPEKVPLIFVTFRKDIEHITHIYIRSEVRDAISRHASSMKVIDVFGSKKQELLESVKKDLNDHLNSIGFEFEMVSFIGGLRCDDNVMRSINATIEATQLAISAQNKIVQAKAEADQAIETARGRSSSVVIEAQARYEAMKLEAQGNDILTKSLTSELVRYRAIEKWTGTPPQVMGGDFSTLLNIKQ
jgi:regulator of protease activity HflC (stomatin/prohibitin superfamily)